jgi:hypothetical protein
MEQADKSKNISVLDTLKNMRGAVGDLKRKWKRIILITFLGAVIGLCYSIFAKPKYTAICTFALEDGGREGMLGQYANLAALAGLDLDNGSSIFKGDNIFELYRSRLMIEKTLLTKVDFNGKRQLLIDRYINTNDLLSKWRDKDGIKQIDFNGNPNSFSRKQDSLITDIAEIFNKKQLDVSKPDKKLSILKVAFTAKDELFAKKFADALVENVNTFYVETKTKKSAMNVRILQRQADSIKVILNSSLYGVASAIDAAPNANPALLSLRVPSQKKQVDVQANTAIYGEIVKNLELSKMSLRQQTPLIQFIDQPILPLSNNKVSKKKGAVLGAFAGFFLIMFVLIAKNVVNALMKSIV